MAIPIRTAEDIARFVVFELGFSARVVGPENSVVITANIIDGQALKQLIQAFGRWSFNVYAEDENVKITVY